MRIFSQTKIHFLTLVVFLSVALTSFSSVTSALCIFGTDCANPGQIDYCNSDDPASAKYCSIDRGTQVVSGNINDIQKDKKFSEYIQDIIAYLLVFLGIVGVVYIIYAGFQILTAAGNDDKVKKSKSTIFHVIIGLLLIFLAYSIVTFFIGGKNGGGLFNKGNSGITGFEFPSFIETTYAYTEYDINTFDNYKKQIELLSSTLDREYQVNNKLTTKTLGSLSSLVKSSMETFPDSDNIVFNTNLANSLLTAIEVVKKNPDSDTTITNLAQNLSAYLTKVKINRIKGKIIASPESGNAPFTVTLRASEVVDPSGVTIQKENYKWWIRTSDGKMSVLGTGPSISYTFQEERTYTVFLNILSASRNKLGKTDVLPFDSSVNINVLPKLGNISLAINGVYVSSLDTVKFTPAQGRQGLLIDPTGSISGAGTKFISTRFEFGNGNVAQYNGAPTLDRQIYYNEGNYKLHMELITNENKKIVKDLNIEIRDPISSIQTDKVEGFARDEFHFNASHSAMISNLGYTWQIVDSDNGEKAIFTSSLQNISYKFPRTGKYLVKLRTLASNGKEDIDTIGITIQGRDPVVSFDTRVVSAESPNTLLFDGTKSYDPDNMDSANLNFSWIIDGVRTDLSNPSRNGALGRYTFDTIGTHKITLEASNKDGKTISYNKDVNIDSLLSVKLLTSPKIGQVGANVSFIADSKEAQTFEWQFGDSETDTSTTGRVNHVYKKAGTYSVNLIVHGRNSDSNSIARKVYVMDSTSPFAIITLKRDNEEIIPTADACDGKEAFVIDRSKAITMSAESSVNTDGTSQGIAYTWKYSTRNSSQKDFSYKFDELGCFPISLAVRSQKTGAQDTARAYVKVENLAPKLSSLTVTADKLDADPVTVTVTANNAVDDDGAIASYIWYYYTEEDPEPQDFRITRTPKTVFVLPRIGAKYYFAVILEDSNGLKVNSDEMTTERYSLTLASDNINTPIISLKTSANSVSVGQKIDFTVTAKNILGVDIASKAEYKWDYNGDGFYEETTNTPTVSHSYDKPGNFNFKVKVTYKGISNTKYQAITVKNEIEPNLEYIAIGKKFIFLNTTKGLYTKVKWSLADVTSNSPDSFLYDFGDENVSGELVLEVSDGAVTKSTTANLRRDVVNAMKVKRSTDKLIYFTYPAADQDEVHIQNNTDKLYIYLGESKSAGVTKYGIDTDILVDSNLNGDATDDMDNKGTDSSVNGSVFAIKSADITTKEKTIRLNLYDANNSIIATKDIKVVYDFISGTTVESLSGSVAELPKDISDTDKANLEKLKDLIKSAKDQDRLKMMQFFSSLQENWFDTREKTKTIIDFEAYLDANSALDTAAKDKFYSLLEGFLLAETQVKDDVGLATKVLKSLIPKTNTSYDQIMKNIDEINSHPTNTTLNKELGTFILNAIKDDSSIEVKDKNIIKSQLQTIIYGGQNNIPTTAVVPETTSSSSGILDWILSFGKILGYVFLGICILIIMAFVYFKIRNKDENIGFQDFIIDKMSGKQPSKTPSYNVAPITEVAPINKQENVQKDILANIASDTQPVVAPDINTPIVPPPTPTVSTEPAHSEEENIPDWLKTSTSLSATSTDVVEPETSVSETSAPEVIQPESIPSEVVQASELPDWLKGAEVTPVEENISVNNTEKKDIAPAPVEPEIETTPNPPSSDIMSELPAWMQGVDVASVEKEVQEELNTPANTSTQEESSYEDIPDWLKSISTTPVENENITLAEAEKEISGLPEIVDGISQEEKQEEKSVKKQTKPTAPKQEKKQEDDAVPDTKTVAHTPRAKKQKPAPIVSEGPVISVDSEELPDWLK